LSEPILFGIPLTQVFLYFVFYSFLGWTMETIYCSVLQKHLVPRGFLLGPICPIYGVGALIMVVFFSRFTYNGALFYVIATVVMSAWEYLVGWLLEATTHMKYWDYSSHRFNLSGRVSLFISLWWGVLAYLTIAKVHPAMVGLVARIPVGLQYTLAGSLGTLLLVDAITTIRKLALTTRMLEKLEMVSGVLRLQAALGKAELGEKVESAMDNLSPDLLELLDTARDNAARNMDEVAERLREKRSELLGQAELYSRRFRRRYNALASKRFAPSLSDVKTAGEALRQKLKAAKEIQKKQD